MSGIKQKLNTITPFLGLVFLLVLFSILTGGKIIAVSNLQNILNQSYMLILLSAGLTFVYAHGGMDFSIGSVYALSQMMAGLTVMKTQSTFLAIVACIGTAMVCSLITGTITVKLNIPPFVASLCMQFLGRGIVNTVLSSTKIVIPTQITALNQWGLKIAILIPVLVILYILLDKTRIGKYNKAIGENPTATEQCGINTKKYRIYAYLISGFMVGLAGFFGLARAGVMTTQTGLNLELDVIIALVLGGLSLSGGVKSSLRCGIIGSLITILLANGLVLIGLNYKFVDAAKGFIFLIVVYLTYYRNKKGLLPR